MSKLFAPILDSKLSAITSNNFTIPFRLPLGVGKEQISSIRAKIKSVSSDDYITRTDNAITYDYWEKEDIDYDNMTVSFNITSVLIKGEYYKIQIAFVEEGTHNIGFYSNMGVFRYITPPELLIEKINDIYSYKISYNKDIIIKYQFILKNKSQIVDDTGYLIDKIINLDESGKIIDYQINYYINYIENCFDESNYELQFNYITSDNYFGSINKVIGNLAFIKEISDAYLDYKINWIENNGCFIVINGGKPTKLNSENYIKIINNKDAIIIHNNDFLKDYLVEQGKSYSYYFIGDDTKIHPFDQDEKQIDFEDIFIYDGEKQLKLAYNPKVSSYKTNLLETKTNTIGGKYPFIFRNGDVNYKEFQLSGLLSTNLDLDNQFIDEEPTEESIRSKTAADADSIDWMDSRTDLTTNNIYRERQFKTNVYNWLTNGKVKLLRTPTEGNFLVRFINVSMTPNDQLSRMLHTVNMTAVEIDECTNENIRKYGLM